MGLETLATLGSIKAPRTHGGSGNEWRGPRVLRIVHASDELKAAATAGNFRAQPSRKRTTASVREATCILP